MKLNELDLNQMFGDFGAAAMQQAASGGQLSVKDRIAKNKFISDFVGRASTNLNSAIQSGLVDPAVSTVATIPAGETPEQVRIRKQKAAQQNIDKTAVPFSKVPPTTAPAPETPEQARIKKQQAAQQGIDKTAAPFSKLPTNQGAVQASNIRQQKQAVRPVMTPKSVAAAPETPEQVRIRKQQAALAAVRESKFNKLNQLLENIINIDEAEEAAVQQAPRQSISSYLQNMFTQYLKIPITDPLVKSQLKTLADAAQAKYPKNQAELTQLANLAFSASYSQGSAPATSAAGAVQNQAMSPMDAIKAGVKQGLGQPEAAPTQAQSPSATAVKPYDQAVSLIAKLGEPEKQQLLNYLTTKTATTPVDKKIIKLNKPAKISPPRGGAPTPDEEAKLQQRIAQAQAAQSK